MVKNHSYRTEGIVLRRHDFGEADRLLTLYSRDLGKIKVIAKGARKPQSRKTGHLELFMRTQLLIATGRQLDLVTQAELIEPYRGLGQSLVRATYAGYAVELLDSFTPEKEPNLSLYQLLSDSLGRFSDSDNLMLAARFYELKLLSLVGFQPQLFYCVVTNRPILQEDQFISAEEGGIVSPSGREKAHRIRPISASAVKLLRYLQTHDWEQLHALSLQYPLHHELEGIMHDYLQYLLEKRLRSAEFLYRLRREASLHVPKLAESENHL